MKTKSFTSDPRWERCSEKHRNSLRAPNPFIHFLFNLVEKYPVDPSIAIETGTHMGYTTELLAELFDKVYSSEKYPTSNVYTHGDLTPIHNELKSRYTGLEIIYEDSPTVLKNVLSSHNDDSFFILLDAHSGDHSPVSSELEILSNDLPYQSHIIMIDDMSDFDKNHKRNNSWPAVSNVLEIFEDIGKSRGLEYRFETFENIMAGVFF